MIPIMKSPSLLLPMFLGLVIAAAATPEITVESAGGGLVSGADVSFGPALAGTVTASKRINDPDGPLNITFAGVPAGIYQPQRSTSEEQAWELVGSQLAPDGAGTVQFEDYFEGQPVIFYRLQRIEAECLEFTVRNSGSSSMTGLNVLLSGPGADHFALNSSQVPLDGILAAGESITLTVCFEPFEVGSPSASLTISSDETGDFTLDLAGSAVEVDPGGDPPPAGPPPGFVLYDVMFVPATAGSPARASGKISGGPPESEVYLEYSTDLADPGDWNLLDFVILDSNGQGNFGMPVSLVLPGTAGASRCFIRAGTFDE